MKAALPDVGDVVRREHISTERLTVFAIDQNIVLKNEHGYFHTVSFDTYDQTYVAVTP